MTEHLTIHTDGAARGNPGPAAFAYILERPGHPPVENAGCLGELTNNQAEYTALVRALEHAARLAPEARLVVRSDSELMVKQMRGEYRVKNEDLRGLYEQARQLVRRFPVVSFEHIRREQNRRADELGNRALDGTLVLTPDGPAREAGRSRAAAASPSGEALAYLDSALNDPNIPSAEEVLDRITAIWEVHGLLRGRSPGPGD